MSRMPLFYGSSPPRPRFFGQPPKVKSDSVYSGNDTHTLPAPASPQQLIIQQQPAITFIDGSGRQIPIESVIDRLSMYSGSNGAHSQADAEQDGLAVFPSIDAIVERDSRQIETRRRDLWKRRAVREYAMNGHHFCGYHPGKNKRQAPRLSQFDEAFQDPYEAAERFGFQMLDLYVAGILLNNGHSNVHTPAENKK